MIKPENKPVVKLLGYDGNAFLIMGKTIKALKKAGADVEYINQYQEEAQSGDYNHLLQTTMKYVEIE